MALADLTGYVFETSVAENSKLIGAPLREAFPLAEEHDVVITGLIRNHMRRAGSARREIVKEGDILVLEGAAESIEQFVGAARLGKAQRGAPRRCAALGPYPAPMWCWPGEARTMGVDKGCLLATALFCDKGCLVAPSHS